MEIRNFRGKFLKPIQIHLTNQSNCFQCKIQPAMEHQTINAWCHRLHNNNLPNRAWLFLSNHPQIKEKTKQKNHCNLRSIYENNSYEEKNVKG